MEEGGRREDEEVAQGWVAQGTLTVLGELQPQVAAEADEIREEQAEEAAEMPEEQRETLLLEQLGSSDPHVCIPAARALIGTARALAGVQTSAMRADGSSQVSDGEARVAPEPSSLMAATVRTIVGTHLKSEDPRVRASAAEVLSSVPISFVAPHMDTVLEGLKDSSAVVGRSVVQIFRKLLGHFPVQSQEALLAREEDLVTLLDDASMADDTVRAFVCEVLHECYKSGGVGAGHAHNEFELGLQQLGIGAPGSSALPPSGAAGSSSNAAEDDALRALEELLGPAADEATLRALLSASGNDVAAAAHLCFEDPGPSRLSDPVAQVAEGQLNGHLPPDPRVLYRPIRPKYY